MEIIDTGAKEMFLPPRNQVLAASTVAAEKPNAVIPFKIGGSITVGTAFLLSVFPHLYDMDGKPFDPYIKENHGTLAWSGVYYPWGPSEQIKPPAEHVNYVVQSSLGIT